MRISTAFSQQSGINALQTQQFRLFQTQQQLSSGLKHLKPSDDPVVAANILGFNNEIDLTRQYQRNIGTVEERIRLEESALESAENILFRAKELTIQAANATVNSGDRISIKAEVDRLLENLLALANTKNANGEYIFAGFLTKTQPFAFDNNLDAYEYLGANEQRLVQISQERRIADGDPGFNLFQKITSVSQEASIADGTRSIFNTLKSLSDTLTSNFPIPEAIIQGTEFVITPIDLTGSTFEITSDTGGPITVSLGGPYATIDALATAINGTAGLSAAGINAQTNGNYLEFVSTTTGSSSSISIDNITGTFGTAAGFANGDSGAGIDLTINSTGQLLFTFTDEILNDLDSALESFLQARTSVGARLRTLENQEAQNEKFILDLQTTLSDLQDLDYAEAISRFNLQNTALEAAQLSFTRVQNLSLFNFL